MGGYQPLISLINCIIMKTATKLSTVSYIAKSASTKLIGTTSSKLLILAPQAAITPSTKIVIANAMAPLTTKITTTTQLGSIGLFSFWLNGLFKAFKLGLAGLLGMALGYAFNFYKKAE